MVVIIREAAACRVVNQAAAIRIPGFYRLFATRVYTVFQSHEKAGPRPGDRRYNLREGQYRALPAVSRPLATIPGRGGYG